MFSLDLKPEVLGIAEVMLGCLMHLQVCVEGLTFNLVNLYAPIMGLEQVHFYQQSSCIIPNAWSWAGILTSPWTQGTTLG